jgi:hypothetical protein
MRFFDSGSLEAVKRNHAVEHATVSMLLGRLQKQTRIVGRASRDGFYIYGDLTSEQIEQSAREGLARMKDGEAHLAISPLCGTNIVVTAILTGIASALAIGSGNRLTRLPNVLTAALLAVVAARPVGALVQRYLTTSPDVDDLEIATVRPMPFPGLHKVTITRSWSSPP